MSEYGSDANITGSLIVDGETDIGSGDDDIDLDAGTLFVDADNDRIGIGTRTPDYELDVAGNMGVDEFIYHNGDDDTFVKFTDDVVILKAGGKSILRGNPDNSNAQILINNGGHDLDLVVKNAASGTLLYTDAGNARVGIGTDAPDYTLDVAGDIGVDQYIYHNGDADTWIRFSDDDITVKAGGKAFLTLEEKNSAPHELTINDGSNNIDFVVKGNGSGEGNPGMKFDASTNRLGINGVGTPDEALHVDGNLKVVGDDPRIKIDGDTDSHPGLELYENGTRKWIIYNNYTNDDLTFKTNSTVRMVIDDDGNVGIGTSPQSSTVRLDVAGGQTALATDKYASPTLHVTNDGDNQYRYGVTIKAGTDDGTCVRGVIFEDGDGTEVGYINWSGGTVTYATFTGAHEAAVVPGDYIAGQDAYDYGTIVKIVSTSQARQKQVNYVIAPTTTAEDKAVLGVYSQNMDPDEVSGANNHQVFALGDGHVLVCNEGGDIEIGDYICSANLVDGHGKKQSDDVLHSYTVAKATEAVIWANESGTTKLISCTYHAS